MSLFPLTKDLNVTNTVDFTPSEDRVSGCLRYLFDRALALEENSTKKETFSYTKEHSFNFIIGNLGGDICFAIPYSKKKAPIDKDLFFNPIKVGEGDVSTAYLANMFIQIRGEVAWKMGSITLLEVKEKNKSAHNWLYTRCNAVLTYVHHERVRKHIEPKGILHIGSRFLRIVEYFPHTLSSLPPKPQYFQEMITGTQDLMSMGIYLFDVKPDNTLIKDRALVIDFPDPIFLVKDMDNEDEWRKKMLKKNLWDKRIFPLMLTHSPDFAHPSLITFRDEYSQIMARIHGNQTVSDEEITFLQTLAEKEISFMLAKTILFRLLDMDAKKANHQYFKPKEVTWNDDLKLRNYLLTDKSKLYTALSAVQCPEQLKLIILQALEDKPAKRPSLANIQEVL